MHFVTELLAHHRVRRLTGAKALQVGRTGNLFQPLLDLGIDFRGGDGYFEPPLEPAGGGQ